MRESERNYELAALVGRLGDDMLVGSAEVAAILGISRLSIQTGSTVIPGRIAGVGRKMQWRLGDLRQFIRGLPADGITQTPVVVQSIPVVPDQGILNGVFVRPHDEVWRVHHIRTDGDLTSHSMSSQRYSSEKAIARARKLGDDGLRAWVQNQQTRERIFESIAEQVHRAAYRATCLRMQSGAALSSDDLDRDLAYYFDLSVRSSNCMKAEGIESLRDLAEYVRAHGWEGLLKIPNLGATSLSQLRTTTEKAVEWCLKHGLP